MKSDTPTVRPVLVFVVTFLRGTGVDADPYRMVTTYYEMGKDLSPLRVIVEEDPFVTNPSGMPKS